MRQEFKPRMTYWKLAPALARLLKNLRIRHLILMLSKLILILFLHFRKRLKQKKMFGFTAAIFSKYLKKACVKTASMSMLLFRTFLIMLSLIHISEPTRLGMISYAVFCLKKKN